MTVPADVKKSSAVCKGTLSFSRSRLTGSKTGFPKRSVNPGPLESLAGLARYLCVGIATRSGPRSHWQSNARAHFETESRPWSCTGKSGLGRAQGQSSRAQT
eukprot:2754791-Rhodomonas_salina.4